MSARSTLPGIPEPQNVEREDGKALTLLFLLQTEFQNAVCQRVP